MNEVIKEGLDNILESQPKKRLRILVELLLILIFILVAAIGRIWYHNWQVHQDNTDSQNKKLYDMFVSQSSKLNRSDSIQIEMIKSVATDQFLLRMKLDTLVNHQTPELIRTINTINNISKEFIKVGKKVGLPLSIKQELKEEPITLINKIEANLQAIRMDSIKKNDF
jgi:hypothetical protein